MTLPLEVPCESILESIADGVFTVDQEWNITSFNRSAGMITGISAQEALGRKCWDVFHSNLCDGECTLDHCMKTGASITNKAIFIVRPDGTKVPISISAAPLFDLHGRLVGGVETFRDLSAINLLRQEIEDSYTFEDIVGKSEPLRRIFRILPQIAKSCATVLLTGESGTGKELFAKAIHNLSPRKDQPLVTVNCGALPEPLLESELFGYKAGAFTDARKDKPGRFDLAQGGTIFLDEIGDVPMQTQVKLLRVLQERTFEPLGGTRSVHADVRVITATNKDLRDLVSREAFREDLFYRLNVVQINLPPLRERIEDIPLLVSHFVRRFNILQNKTILGLSQDAVSLFLHHSFPGNVRELINILEYAFILCSEGFIGVEHLPEWLQPNRSPSNVPAERPLTLEQIKCRAVLDCLRRNKGRKMATCRELNISKDTLRRIVQRHSDSGAFYAHTPEQKTRS
jgi:sigma-54 dependent transcriptional regulator, acetoin dehydrogenase operon transcriptional activator AcoR